ncbi:MAG: cyclic nucleotide-binding domain-containing protein [Anaerolineae bacterium]|nr:cyclic nucleotide-binding domain-containing protein [Anaerolineae bacterium]
MTRQASWPALLHTWLDLHPGEGRYVAWMMVYSAAATGGVLTVGQAISSALFLSRLSQSATAYLYILPAIFIAPAMLLYNQLAGRRPLLQVFIGSNSLLLGVVVLFRILLLTSYSHDFWTLAGIYLFIEFSYTLVLLQFWTFAGQIFNPREAKRLYGLIAAGGSLANILAGLSLGALAHRLGAPNLLFVVAGALALCILSVWQLKSAGRLQVEVGRQTPTAASRVSLAQTVRDMAGSPLLGAIALLTILLALLVNIASYQYYNALQATFGSHTEDMVAFTGRYEFWAGLAALFVQVYLTQRVLRHFGVFAALLCYPLGVGLGSAAALVSGGALWAMALTRANTPVFRRTINVAALNVLYLAIPSRLRQRAAAIIEVLYAVSFGLLGLLFLVVDHASGWAYLTWSVVALGLAAAWLVVLALTPPHYLRALAESIRRRSLDLAAVPIDLTDPTAIRLLRDTLRQPDHRRVVHALGLITDARGVDWDADVAALLLHPAPEVRSMALTYLARPGATAYRLAAQTAWHDTDESVRVAAIQAYATIGGAEATTALSLFLQASEARIVGAALVSLARWGGPVGEALAAETHQRLLVSADAAMRLEGVRALARLPSPPSNVQLLPLFDDPDTAVRLAALRASGEMRLAGIAPSLMAYLGRKGTQEAAIAALARYGLAIEPLLADAVRDRRRPVEVRAAIPRVLQRIGGPRSVELLLAGLDEADEAVRGAVYRALAQLHAAAPFAVQPARLRRALADELRAVYGWYGLHDDLASGLDPLLDEAVTRRAKRGLERIFDLLSLLYPGGAFQSVRRTLSAPEGTRQAEAVELLDNLVAPEDKSGLLPLLEESLPHLASAAHREWGVPRRSMTERLTELARGEDAWLRACALARLGALRLAELASIAREALADSDDLARESALVACHQFLDRQAWAAIAAQHAAGLEYPLSRAYAQASLQEAGATMPLATIEKVLFLRGVDLFGELASEDLAAVARIATEVTLRAGERFITQGDLGDCLYIVVEGEASIVRQEVGELMRRGPGDIMGEMAIISHRPRSAHCLAITDITALKVTHDDFWQLMEEQPPLARAMMIVLATRLDETVSNLARYRNANATGSPVARLES